MLNLVKIDKGRMTVYHRTKLSISKNDKSFVNYLKEYGLFSPRPKKESSKNYLGEGVYFTTILLNDNKNYNFHYGDWIIKCEIPLGNLFIIDWDFYKYLYGDCKPGEHLEIQFAKYGKKFDSNKISPILFYSKFYYKIYRLIENDLKSIRNYIDGVLFHEFNYLDPTDTNVFLNKRIDNYQCVIFKSGVISGLGYKYKTDIKFIDLEFDCRNFNYLEYIKKVNDFSKSNFKKLSDFDDDRYKFNAGLYYTQIHSALNTIYSKTSTEELLYYKSLLPDKLCLQEFNKGITILNRYIDRYK